ncbi:hypothetical protein BP6252_07247 [Coleophoma cylindrospora]|uniref:Methyltransferase tdiE n=1 Tax=Coleophoma cylindrospora TaxID=1849047 RepID=A0A3D8RH94_9HELO|nr:hypothetical protein BP6252_07247 [Coleophoma cylindrospora]
MGGAFRDWPAFGSNAFANTRPGGYLELQDIDGLACDDDTFSPDPPSCLLAEWWLNVCRAFDAGGRKMNAAAGHAEMMRNAGFVDVKETIIKWPINNRWPGTDREKEVGMWSMVNTLDALEALTIAPFTRSLGWSQEAVQALLTGVRKDVRDEKIHAYWKIRVIYGRRPEE